MEAQYGTVWTSVKEMHVPIFEPHSEVAAD